MLRSRTRSDFEANSVKGSYLYTSGYGGTIDRKFPAYDGSSQFVIDYPPFARFGKHKALPGLNPVQMSKIVMLPPKQPVVIYKGKNSFGTALASGANLAMLDIQPGAGTWNPPAALPLTTVSTQWESYLLQRAYARASSAEYGFGVTIGEIAETAAFLAKPLETIIKLSNKAFRGISHIYRDGVKTSIKVSRRATKRQVRRIHEITVAHPLSSSLRVIDESANHWLAYKFGVLPVLDDVQKALKFRDENLKRHLGIQISRVKGMLTDVTTSMSVLETSGYNPIFYDVFIVKRVIDQHFSGLYWKNCIQAPLYNFLEGIGFAPPQLVTLAYELIPLSFVVDRFIDIKSFVLGNIGSLEKQTFGSYCSRKIETTYSSSVANIKFGSSRSWLIPCNANSQLIGGARFEQLARSVNSQRPNFPVVNPAWREQLVADATNMSLIWGRLRTHVGKIME